MRTDRIFSGFLILLGLASCASSYQITGASRLRGAQDGMLYLVGMDGERVLALDSASIDNGLFNLEGNVDSVRMVTIYIDGEGIMPVILEEGDIKIEISNDALRCSGTPLNNRLYKFIEERNALSRRFNELERTRAQLSFFGSQDSRMEQMVLQENEIMRQLSAHTINFIRKNFKNVLGPSVFMMETSSMPYPKFSADIMAIFKDAPEEFMENAYVRSFYKAARENEQILQSSSFSFQFQESYEWTGD